MNNIRFHHTKRSNLHQVAKLRAFILDRCRTLGYQIDLLQFIFVDDETLLQMNRAYLQHDYYTDILTFDQSTTSMSLFADIYISVDRVRENAQIFNTTYTHECHRIIFHGILHLVGFVDKSDSDKLRMSTEEDSWLKAYFKQNAKC